MAFSVLSRLKGFFTSDAVTHAGGLLTGMRNYAQAPHRGTKELLEAYQRLPYLHRVARMVAEDTAGVPLQVLAPGRAERKGGLARAIRRAHGTARRELVTKAVANGELTPLDAHPFLDVMADPCPALAAHDVWAVWQLYFDLVGQAPLIRENSALGTVVELWPAPPHWVQQVPCVERPFYRLAWGTTSRELPEEALVWGRVVDPLDPYSRGVSYGVAMSRALDVSEGRQDYAAAFFANNAIPAGIVAVKGVTSTVQLQQVQAEWDQAHRGAQKAGRLRFMPEGSTFTTLGTPLGSIPLKDMREEDRALVAEILSIPLDKLGVAANSTRAYSENVQFRYAVDCLVPRMNRKVATLQPLLAEWDESLVLGYHSPVPEDLEARRLVMGTTKEVFTVNEHRASAGMPPLVSGGDELFKPAPTPQASPFGALSLPEPEWVKSLRPLSVRTKSETAVRNALEALRPRALSIEVEPIQDEAFQAWAKRVLGELGVDVSFDMRNPLVQEYLAEAGKRIKGITATTRAELTDYLNEGVHAGEGIRELAQRVEDVMDVDGPRARTIARTETVGTSNAANLAAWEQSGVVEGKEWLSIHDGRSGERHHERMDGVRVALDEAFTLPSGAKARAPGQSGVASEDINCRCTGLPVVADPEKRVTRTVEQRKAMGDAEERRREAMEETFERAVRRGLRAQCDAVLAALRG